MQKLDILCPKTPLLTEKQLLDIYSFVATRNVCPLVIPESYAQNMGLRLLESEKGSSRGFSEREDDVIVRN